MALYSLKINLVYDALTKLFTLWQINTKNNRMSYWKTFYTRWPNFIHKWENEIRQKVRHKYCHSHLIKLCTVKENGTLPKEWISSSLWILKLALWTLNKRLYLSVYDQFLTKNTVRLTTHCHFKISSATKM